jgi:hypothetical protein
MSRKKCPECSLSNFATAETCKRCNTDLAAIAPSLSREPPTEYVYDEGPQVGSAHPILAWIVTIDLVTTNLVVTYNHGQAKNVNTARLLGQMTGALIAWPCIFLIIYGASRRFREKYAFHTVINYGLAMNALVSFFM